jgi:hypothetical protein
MLESACEDFEFLGALIKREISIEVRHDPPVQMSRSAQLRAGHRIQMALAKSFLFFSVRAHRICDHGAGSLHLPREERRLFLATTLCIVPVRDVNEHGYDANAKSESTPTLHFHELEDAMVDETALVVLGPERILIGPLNLCDIYRAVDRMRKLAGFAALARIKP